MSVFCSKGHAGRFTNHGPNVGQGWYCPECKDDIPHSDNVYGSSARLAKRADVIYYPKTGDQINCVKSPCRACHGVYRKLPPFEIKVGDIITCNNARALPELELNKSYEVFAVEASGLRIRVLNKGVWEHRSYSRCRFVFGGKL